jgi:hypothetical protein
MFFFSLKVYQSKTLYADFADGSGKIIVSSEFHIFREILFLPRNPRTESSIKNRIRSLTLNIQHANAVPVAESSHPEQKKAVCSRPFPCFRRVTSWLVSSSVRRLFARRSSRIAGKRRRREFARRNWRTQPNWAVSAHRARDGDPSGRRNVFAWDVGAWIELLGKYQENGREGN